MCGKNKMPVFCPDSIGVIGASIREAPEYDPAVSQSAYITGESACAISRECLCIRNSNAKDNKEE